MPAPPDDWKLGAGPLLRCFERGLITRLSLEAGVTCRFISLRQLILGEPVTEIVIDVGHPWRPSALAFRTLPAFPRPVRVTVQRFLGNHEAFMASLLSSPVFASATELVVSGLYRRELVNWLAKSPFLGEVRSLNLARNALHDEHAGHLARLTNLPKLKHLDVTANLIREAGAAVLRARFGDGLVV